MYLPIENGSIVEVPDNSFGFVYNCYIPPIGYGINSMTGELQKTDMLCRSEIPEEQYWERIPLPSDYKKRRVHEKKAQQIDRNYFDPYLEKFRREDWNRRLCGVWFLRYNPKLKKSEWVYITGQQYLYINWWVYQGKMMDYREPDRETFYVYQYCQEDHYCLGLNEIMQRKNGKCFKINTLIRMYDGSVKAVQDIRDGELVMGDDSTPRMVYGCTSGDEEMFEIIPNKGKSFTVNKSHILHCVFTKYSSKTKIKKREYLNITVSDYLNLPNSIKRRLTIRRVGWGDWESNGHIVDPYFLGVWLGDGKSTNLQVTNQDEEIIDYLKDYCNINGLKYHNCGAFSKSGVQLQHLLGKRIENKVSYNNSGEWVDFDNKEQMMRFLGKNPKTPLKTFGRFKNGQVILKERTENHIWNELKRLNLPNNKHIPKEYLIDSRENRLKLLAGIIDTDGCLVFNGKTARISIVIGNRYERFQNDFLELVQSLGFYCGYKKQSGRDSILYSIFGDLHEIPCKIKRKQCPKYKKIYDSSIAGFKVKSVGHGKYYGFAVNDNHLFLLNDGTVVHNTGRTGCIGYERTSRLPYHHCGIQSKSDTDAKDMFKKAFVHPWRKLPDFYRPVYDLMKGDDPNDELRFFATSRRGQQSEWEEQEEALESWVDYATSEEGGYDGPELHTYISDETGKTRREVSVKERQRVVKMASIIDGIIKGKHFFTTTVEVEEGEEENKEFEELTAQSNPLNRNENGMTMSGLYTFFQPAYKYMYFDKYGFPDEERAKTSLLNERKKLEEEGDLRGLSSIKRKKPMTFAEAFSSDGLKTLYNPELINMQLDNIRWRIGEFIETGDLIWKDGFEFVREQKQSDGTTKLVPNELIWVPSINGVYQKVKGWSPKNPNSVFINNGMFIPNDVNSGIMGADPFKYDKTKDKRRSNAASFYYQIPDGIYNSTYDDMFCIRYSRRPEGTYIANMDILKMAWWCGCKVLFERNVNHWKKDFEHWKCSGFLVWMPGEVEPGIYTRGNSVTSAVQTICNYTESYINKNIEKVFFPSLLSKDTGWLGFKVEDTEKYDEPMAAGITLIGVHGIKRVFAKEKREIESILPLNKAS